MVDISMIITTRNEQLYLEGCIESIKKQNYPLDKTELIVVDNHSTDRTVEIAKSYTGKVFSYGPERSAQRNFGVRQAVGKYILYLDADMILSPGVLADCIEMCEKEGFIALYIPVEIIGSGFWIKVRNFEQSFYSATVIDCIRFIKKDKFYEVDGFDESLTGPEDWDFDRKIHSIGKVGKINALLYHNEDKFTIKRYLNKKGYYSKSFKHYVKKWGRQDEIVRKQLGPIYRYFGIFFQNKGYMKLLKHPALTLGMYFLRFLVGITYLMYR